MEVDAKVGVKTMESKGIFKPTCSRLELSDLFLYET